jgi:hypothetical protein
MIQLVRWSTEMGIDDAMKEVFSDDFDASDGADDRPAVRKVLFFGETVGSLVKHLVLDWDLLSDLSWFEGMWKRVAARAQVLRDRDGEPRIFEHFESLATRSSE